MSSGTGKIPVHRSTRGVALGRAAYSSSDLHPTVAPTGRYAMPTEGRPYVWRDPARFQKLMTAERARANGVK